MPRRIARTTLRRSQTMVHRALLGVLGVTVISFLSWQSYVIIRHGAGSTAASNVNTTDAARASFTEYFNVMHREVPTGNTLVESVWYTPQLTQALLNYAERSTHQQELASMLGTVNEQQVLSFTVLLTTEVSDIENFPVGEHVRAQDNTGHTYAVLGWQRMNPRALAAVGDQKQEVGLLLVSVVADDGTSFWQNDSSSITITVDSLDNTNKTLTWQKSLATDLNTI